MMTTSYRDIDQLSLQKPTKSRVQHKIMDVTFTNLEASVKGEQLKHNLPLDKKVLNFMCFGYKTISTATTDPDDGSNSKVKAVLEETNINLTPSTTTCIAKILKYQKGVLSTKDDSAPTVKPIPVIRKAAKDELDNALEVPLNNVSYDFHLHSIQLVILVP